MALWIHNLLCSQPENSLAVSKRLIYIANTREREERELREKIFITHSKYMAVCAKIDSKYHILEITKGKGAELYKDLYICRKEVIAILRIS